MVNKGMGLLGSKSMTVQSSKKIIQMPQLTAENDNVKQEKKDYSYLYYLKVCLWDKFFSFKGRARRKEYITFQLFDLCTALLFYGIVHYIAVGSSVGYTLYNVISTILIVPLITVTVRRFHDAGFSGWWCLLGIIPFITVAFLAIKDSERSDNKFGEVPMGKTFGAPLWSNYAFKKASAETKVVPLAKASPSNTKRKKKAA